MNIGTPDFDVDLRYWGYRDIPGSGSQTSPVQAVRKSETGESFLAGKQFLLHEAVFLLCGEEVSKHDGHGCCERTETGLACGQGVRAGIHSGAASGKSGGSSVSNRERGNIFAEGTPLSDHRQRSGGEDGQSLKRIF